MKWNFFSLSADTKKNINTRICRNQGQRELRTFLLRNSLYDPLFQFNAEFKAFNTPCFLPEQNWRNIWSLNKDKFTNFFCLSIITILLLALKNIYIYTFLIFIITSPIYLISRLNVYDYSKKWNEESSNFAFLSWENLIK